MSAPTAAGRVVTIDPAKLPLSVAEREMLGILTRCAEAGEPCPTNTTLGRMMKVGQPFAETTLSRLKGKGHVTSRLVDGSRVVTIVATGKSTQPYAAVRSHAARVTQAAREKVRGLPSPDTLPEDASARLHEATLAMYRRAGVRMGCDWAMAGARILAAAL